MNAVKGLFPDASGNYTVKGEPDVNMAVQLLHSEEYHREKLRSWHPLTASSKSLKHERHSSLTKPQSK